MDVEAAEHPFVPWPQRQPELGTRWQPPEGRWAALVSRCWPRAWSGARIAPGRPGAVALAVVAGLAAVLAAAAVWWDRPQAEPVGGLPGVPAVTQPAVAAAAAGADPPSTPTAPDPAAAGSSPTGSGPAAGAGVTAAAPSPPPPAPLVVNVSGKVQRPGLVHVPDGARVADALDAAGGALPGTDLAQLNLARRVQDGEQVAVGVRAAPDAAAATGANTGAGPRGGSGGGPTGAGPAATGPIDLNTATVEQLDGLPGVGPVTAQRILEWRSRNGRFSRVDQLREIEGIGERRFGQLRELVSV